MSKAKLADPSLQSLRGNNFVRNSNSPEIADIRTSKDGTHKFLLVYPDKELVECVVMFLPKSVTLCLSSQSGCPLGCTFCCTGQTGFRRNLTAEEIIEQARIIGHHLYDRQSIWPSRLVFMGMGEPLLNFGNVIRATQSLATCFNNNMSWRKILISTIGIPDQLERLGKLRIALPALSLHAPNQSLRNQLMPGAARWPLRDILDILRQYPLPKRERFVIEYILIHKVNDFPEHAHELAQLVKMLPVKINLIPCNPSARTDFKAPSPERINEFYRILKMHDQTVFLRKSHGPDIRAACGQLRAENVFLENIRQ